MKYPTKKQINFLETCSDSFETFFEFRFDEQLYPTILFFADKLSPTITHEILLESCRTNKDGLLAINAFLKRAFLNVYVCSMKDANG